MDAKKMVQKFLDERAKADELFAKDYKNPKKSMDECWKFILGEARKKGSAVCMSDAEVYGLAVHYYDEKDIKVEALPKGMDVQTKVEEKPKKKKVEEKRKEIEKLQLDLFA